MYLLVFYCNKKFSFYIVKFRREIGNQKQVQLKKSASMPCFLTRLDAGEVGHHCNRFCTLHSARQQLCFAAKERAEGGRAFMTAQCLAAFLLPQGPLPCNKARSTRCTALPARMKTVRIFFFFFYRI
jgi:hypothetical protein